MGPPHADALQGTIRTLTMYATNTSGRFRIRAVLYLGCGRCGAERQRKRRSVGMDQEPSAPPCSRPLSETYALPYRRTSLHLRNRTTTTAMTMMIAARTKMRVKRTMTATTATTTTMMTTIRLRCARSVATTLASLLSFLISCDDLYCCGGGRCYGCCCCSCCCCSFSGSLPLRKASRARDRAAGCLTLCATERTRSSALCAACQCSFLLSPIASVSCRLVAPPVTLVPQSKLDNLDLARTCETTLARWSIA